MKARAVAALAVVFVSPWMAANNRAIDRIPDAKTRQTQRAVFNRTLSQLQAAQKGTPARLAPEARALAQTILSDRALYSFGSAQKAPPKTWWQRLQEWIGERWKALVKALFGRAHLPAAAGVAIGRTLLAISILSFMALLARLLLTYSHRSLPGASHARPLRGAENAATFASRATAYATRGEYNAAVAAIFRAALFVVSERGAPAVDEARTLGELRRHVRAGAPKLAPQFDVLSRLLTLSVYADASLTHTDWEQARVAYERLRDSAAQDDAA